MNQLHYYTTRIAILFSLLFITNSIIAATYTTLTNGNWSNTTNVWSTNGVTPCGCNPGVNVSNQTINILHNITLDANLRFGANTQFYLLQNRTLAGNFFIDVYASYMNIEGNIILRGFRTQHPGANVFLNSSGSIQTSSSFEMHGGIVHVRSGYIRSNSAIVIDAGSTLRLTHSSKVESNNSIANNGVIDMDSGSCIQSTGTFQNNPLGQVLGTGAVRSTAGNVRNEPLGVWDPTVNWCSAGGGSYGQPSPMNCGVTDAICNGIVLPIELSYFTAELKQELYTEINWSTASENNNAYFRVMKLSEGDSNWKEIETVDGSGTTTETMYYRSVDKNVQMGITYYRLIQVNYDGQETYTDVVSVNRKGEGDALSLYPNPSYQHSTLVINNLKKSDGVISICDLKGNVIYQENTIGESNYKLIPTDNLTSGVYIVCVTQLGQTQNLKLVIQ